jgi:1-acyl-sn-glycerol-3-phosphate acyltransferase
MIDPFPGDAYKTPEGLPQALSERVLFGTRWSVYSHFFATILRNRALAVRGLYGDEAWVESSLEIMRNLERCAARFDIRGLDRLRSAEGPLVLVSNHMSTLETLVLPTLVQPAKPVTFVVKRKLTEGFFWGPIMRSRDPIVVSRKDPRADLEAVLSGGQERLAAGISVIVFPQGTRTQLWRREGFNSLGLKLALKAGVRVMPVALKTDYWGSSGIFRGFGPVHREREIRIEFGESLRPSGRGKAEQEACLDFIEGRLREWGAKMPEGKA